MAAELFKMMTGTDLVHVPYRSSFMPDLLSGQVQVAFTPIPLTIANIRAGKLRAIAVTSADAVGRAARHSYRGANRAGLRGHHLARHRRAQGHA